MVFDQGVGDLFVVRVAGNIIAPSQAGSVEFAAAEFGTRLVVVLGHTQCGAVAAAIRSIQNANTVQSTENEQSPNILSVVSRIQPHIVDLVERDSGENDTELALRAMQANVCASVDQLRSGSKVLKTLIANEGLRVVGAEYDIKTGIVTFIDTATNV